MQNNQYDIAIVGGGIVGLATAYKLQFNFSHSKQKNTLFKYRYYEPNLNLRGREGGRGPCCVQPKQNGIFQNTTPPPNNIMKTRWALLGERHFCFGHIE